MEISTVNADDLPAVLRLNEQSVPHVNSISLADMRWFADQAAFFQVARIDTRLAGFLIGLRPGVDYKSLNYRWFCEHRDNFAYVDRVAVASWARRRGVAEALYKAFIASQADAPVLTCEVNIRPRNDVSMRFHEQLGFRQIGTQATENGSKQVALLEKVLP